MFNFNCREAWRSRAERNVFGTLFKVKCFPVCLFFCLSVCVFVCSAQMKINWKWKSVWQKVLPSGFDPYTLGLNRVKSQPCHLTNSLIIWLYCLNDLVIFYPLSFFLCPLCFMLVFLCFFFGTNEFLFWLPQIFFRILIFLAVCLFLQRKEIPHKWSYERGKERGAPSGTILSAQALSGI